MVLRAGRVLVLDLRRRVALASGDQAGGGGEAGEEHPFHRAGQLIGGAAGVRSANLRRRAAGKPARGAFYSCSFGAAPLRIPRPMPNRIDTTFAAPARAGRKALIAYISAGDPKLAATPALCRALEKAGVDLLELGVPFSDPLADGIVNQLAASRALAAGATVRGVLRRCGKSARTRRCPSSSTPT